MKNNKLTYIVIALTVLLAGIAIFTAVRLFQLRDEQVAPNAPESEPAAQNVQDAIACEPVSFTLASAEEESSPFVTSSPTPTASPSSGAGGGLTATATPTATATASATPTPTATTIAQATATPSTSTSSALPDAGFTLPTFIIMSAGLLLILTAFALAL